MMASSTQSPHCVSSMDFDTFFPVVWDVATRRPIVDGKVINAQTGEPQEAVGPTRSGPPSIDFIWHNLHCKSSIRTIRGPKDMTVNQLFVAVAKHVKDGLYELISVDATAYAFIVICSSEKDSEECNAAWTKM